MSSNQIDNPDRGFSFQNEGPLDMKMGSSNLNAYEIVNSFDETKLADIFFNLEKRDIQEKLQKILLKIEL